MIRIYRQKGTHGSNGNGKYKIVRRHFLSVVAAGSQGGTRVLRGEHLLDFVVG